MSDAPQGEGWWQASDLKWYPPQGGAPPTRPTDENSSSKKQWVLATVVLVVVALLAAGTTFLLSGGDDTASASTVTLEPVAATGTDPFTTSTTITEVADFPDSVKAVTTQLTSELTTNPTTGTLTTTGTTPGLYGGTRDNTACDSQALTDYLTDNPSKANAWATTQNIDTDDITDYIAGLTSAILTTDTLVTNHGYKNGKATARQSVLQAGTAVLIDNTGTPRARCSCGNPLTPPTKQKLTTQNTTGTPWTGYTTTNVTLITTGDTTTNNTFTFTDITTGDTYQQPIANATPTTTAPSTTVPAGAPVILTENGIRVTAPDGTVTDFDTTSSPWTAAVAALRAALGEPTQSQEQGAEVCEPAVFSWGGFQIVGWNDAYFYVTSSASADVPGNDRVTTDRGVKAGDTVAAFVAAHPDATQVAGAYFIDTDGSGRGVAVYPEGDVVSTIGGGADRPTDEYGDC